MLTEGMAWVGTELAVGMALRRIRLRMGGRSLRRAQWILVSAAAAALAVAIIALGQGHLQRQGLHSQELLVDPERE